MPRILNNTQPEQMLLRALQDTIQATYRAVLCVGYLNYGIKYRMGGDLSGDEGEE